MVAKISPVAVVKEAVALIKFRWRLFLSVAVGIYALSLPLMVMMAGKTTEELFSTNVCILFAVLMLIGFTVNVCMTHHCISTLRGQQPSPLPDRFIGKTFKSILKIFLLILALIIPMTVVILGTAIPMGMLIESQGSDASTAMDLAGLIVGIFGSLFGFYYFAVRLGFSIPPIAVDEESSLKLSWKMTRGHSFRILLFAFPFIVFNLFGQAVYGTGAPDSPFNPYSATAMIYSFVGMALTWFTFAIAIVWYVRLKERYESMNGMSSMNEMSAKQPVADLTGKVNGEYYEK